MSAIKRNDIHKMSQDVCVMRVIFDTMFLFVICVLPSLYLETHTLCPLQHNLSLHQKQYEWIRDNVHTTQVWFVERWIHCSAEFLFKNKTVSKYFNIKACLKACLVGVSECLLPSGKWKIKVPTSPGFLYCLDHFHTFYHF